MGDDFDFDTGRTGRRYVRPAGGGWGVEAVKGVGWMLAGVALAYVILTACGYALADRKTVQVIQELRAWAADPVAQRRTRETLKALDDTAAAMRKNGEAYKNLPALPPIPRD